MADTRDERHAGQGDMAPEDQRWLDNRGESWADDPQRPDSPNRNAARDEGRSLNEEAALLADSLIGQKATTEGTAGANDTEPPTGAAARTGGEQAGKTSAD